MKKTALLLLGVLLALFCFSGCGENENAEIIGKWIPTTAQINGETIQYNELDVEAGKFELNFTSDGKCKATLAGILNEGSYTFNGTSVDIDVNGEIQKLDYYNGMLTLVLNYGNNSTIFTFTKARE